MISTDSERKATPEHPSPASASSSTLVITPLPSTADSKDSLTLPQVVPRSTKALRPSTLSISLPLSTSSPPPQRMSGKGFVEPHRSHLPRRANTTKSRGSVRAETPRKSVEPPSNSARPENDEDPFAISPPHASTGRHSVNPTSANANNGHMPTQLLSLRIAEPSVRTTTPTSSSLPQTPPLPPRTPLQTPSGIPGTPAQTPKGHLEPQSANLPRRHQRSVKAPERDGSPVSKVRHARSMSRSRLGSGAGKNDTNDGIAEEGERFPRDTRGEERRTRSMSRHRSERSRFGPPLRAGKDAEKTEEGVPLDLKEYSKSCLQEMGKGSGVFVGFLPDEINVEHPQERLHVVVQSNTDRLVLPLPPLPPPIESYGELKLWSATTCAENRTYLDGMTALTDAQIQEGCSFIEGVKQTPQDGSESPSRVRILSPRLRPEDAMSLAICYLAYSSPCLIKPSPSVSKPLLSSIPIMTPSSDTNSDSPAAPPSSINDAGAARLIPFGSELTREQIVRTRQLSFPGSWDDEFGEIDVVNVDSSSQPNPAAKYKEPRYTPAHALYMHLLDDIDSDADLERELWDAEEEAFAGRMGVVPLGFGGGVGRSANGELEAERVANSEASTTKSVHGAQGSACNRRRDHESNRDSDRDRERGMEYKCIRSEWRGVLSFEGLRRLDGVWLGGSS